jgi:EmrB/QacA subfamily drug resistance transporter
MQAKIDKRALLVVTMASNFFNPLMGAAINVALKKIGLEFSISAVGLSWVSMSYLLASAAFLVPMGKLGDTLGRKRMFLLGNLLFAGFTLLCGFAISAPMLIVLRVLQGVSSAMMVATSMALIISAFPPQERGKVIGLNVSAVYVGSSVAPLIGGLLTDSFGWRGIFLMNAVASALIATLVLTRIRGELEAPVRETFDWKGTILYIVSIVAFMLGFSKLPEISAIVLTIVGVLGMIWFVRLELRTTHPVLNINLFAQNKVFALSNVSAIINYAATFAMSFMMSLYLQYVKGFSAREAGIVLMAQPIVMALVASFSGRLSDKRDPHVLSSMGMAISSVGLLILTFVNGDTSIAYIVGGLMVLGFGFGLFSSPNTNAAMSSVDRKVYGSASSVLSTMRNSGMILSMAMASLSMHVLLGNAQINDGNMPQFIVSMKFIFLVFTILCALGVFTSLFGFKQKTIKG